MTTKEGALRKLLEEGVAALDRGEFDEVNAEDIGAYVNRLMPRRPPPPGAQALPEDAGPECLGRR